MYINIYIYAISICTELIYTAVSLLISHIPLAIIGFHKDQIQYKTNIFWLFLNSPRGWQGRTSLGHAPGQYQISAQDEQIQHWAKVSGYMYAHRREKKTEWQLRCSAGDTDKYPQSAKVYGIEFASANWSSYIQTNISTSWQIDVETELPVYCLLRKTMDSLPQGHPIPHLRLVSNCTNDR